MFSVSTQVTSQTLGLKAGGWGKVLDTNMFVLKNVVRAKQRALISGFQGMGLGLGLTPKWQHVEVLWMMRLF